MRFPEAKVTPWFGIYGVAAVLALGVAADMIRGGGATKMLVVGTEKLSPTIDMHDRGNCFIFADGAAAVVVGETSVQGIGPLVAGSDGEQADAIRQDIDWITFAQNPSGPRPFVRPGFVLYNDRCTVSSVNLLTIILRIAIGTGF